MKELYSVIYLFGKVAGVVGPWPEDAEDYCTVAKESMMQTVEREFAGKDTMRQDGKIYHRGDFVVVCEYRDTRPKIGDFEGTWE